MSKPYVPAQLRPSLQQTGTYQKDFEGEEGPADTHHESMTLEGEGIASTGELEEVVGDEETQTHDPMLKKPQYHGRELMGYEWNRYNQTHYDAESPPPKVVQGYEFNIHYPDLVGTGRAPTYKIVRDRGRKRGQLSAPAGEEDRCNIKFIAGPPYQNLTFRIVDRAWDYSAKRERGYESTFEEASETYLLVFSTLTFLQQGTLRLHFHFRRVSNRESCSKTILSILTPRKMFYRK